MKKICIISSGYPTKDNPAFSFIQPVARKLAECYSECKVVAPQSLTQILIGKKKKRKYKWVDRYDADNVDIIQPLFISLPAINKFFKKINEYSQKLAIKYAFKKEKLSIDIIYAHFWYNGALVCEIARKKGIPLVVVTGESKIEFLDIYSGSYIDKMLQSVSGVICVSSKNHGESKDLGLFKYNPETVILPNGYNPNEFYKISREQAREELGIPQNDRIAIFVGSFCERKGVLRVVEAVERVEGLKLILIGKGDQIPQSDRILFSGQVPHDGIVKYLNAADMFVLPTRAEGCCNAIVEAMACGLPIISSNLPFNDDILDDSNSLRINPDDIEEIANSLKKLSENEELCSKLSNGSLEKAKDLTIQKRVENIYKFIENLY